MVVVVGVVLAVLLIFPPPAALSACAHTRARSPAARAPRRCPPTGGLRRRHSLALTALALASRSGPSRSHPASVRYQRASADPDRGPPSYDQQHPPTPSAEVLPPGAVARRFVRALLACTYHQAPCTQIPGVYPAYAKLVEPQLTDTPATHADLSICPRIVSAPGVQLSAAGRRHSHIQHWTRASAPAAPQPRARTNGWQVYAVPEFSRSLPCPTRSPAACTSVEPTVRGITESAVLRSEATAVAFRLDGPGALRHNTAFIRSK